MKATLYEALGISPTASDEDVRASLRRLIRKYYTKTRDGHGNVEEALRFINHASRILSDSDRRRRYDQELAVSLAEAKAKFKVGGIVGKIGGGKIEIPKAGIVSTKGSSQVLRTGGGNGGPGGSGGSGGPSDGGWKWLPRRNLSLRQAQSDKSGTTEVAGRTPAATATATACRRLFTPSLL